MNEFLKCSINQINESINKLRLNKCEIANCVHRSVLLFCILFVRYFCITVLSIVFGHYKNNWRLVRPEFSEWRRTQD